MCESKQCSVTTIKNFIDNSEAMNTCAQDIYNNTAKKYTEIVTIDLDSVMNLTESCYHFRNNKVLTPFIFGTVTEKLRVNGYQVSETPWYRKLYNKIM